jgi:hypothetical protein
MSSNNIKCNTTLNAKTSIVNQTYYVPSTTHASQKTSVSLSLSSFYNPCLSGFFFMAAESLS